MGMRCTKYCCLTAFLLLASLGHWALFQRLLRCKECIPQVQWQAALDFPFGEEDEEEDLSDNQLTFDERKITLSSSSVSANVVETRPLRSMTMFAPNETISNGSEQQHAAKVVNVSLTPKRWVYNRTGWRPLPDSHFKVPFPVFVASLPKSGTTSIYAYFMCGRVRSVHTYCPFKNKKDKEQIRVGALIEDNIKNGQPPFEGCGNGVRTRLGPVKVFSDTGYVAPRGSCYYPSVSGLEAMYEAYPQMTILLGIRNSTKWYESIKSWGKGTLMQRWTRKCTFMPAQPEQKEYIEFYEWHNRHIRKFAKRHPSITYIEFEIDSPTAGMDLEEATNISSSCWGHSKPIDSLSIIAMRRRGMAKKNKMKNETLKQPENLALQQQSLPKIHPMKGSSKIA